MHPLLHGSSPSTTDTDTDTEDLIVPTHLQFIDKMNTMYSVLSFIIPIVYPSISLNCNDF